MKNSTRVFQFKKQIELHDKKDLSLKMYNLQETSITVGGKEIKQYTYTPYTAESFNEELNYVEEDIIKEILSKFFKEDGPGHYNFIPPEDEFFRHQDKINGIWKHFAV